MHKVGYTDCNFIVILSQSVNYDKCSSISNVSRQASSNHYIKFRIYKSNKYQIHNARLSILAIISYLYGNLYVMYGDSDYLRNAFVVIIQNCMLMKYKLICEMINVQVKVSFLKIMKLLHH